MMDTLIRDRHAHLSLNNPGYDYIEQWAGLSHFDYSRWLSHNNYFLPLHPSHNFHHLNYSLPENRSLQNCPAQHHRYRCHVWVCQTRIARGYASHRTKSLSTGILILVTLAGTIKPGPGQQTIKRSGFLFYGAWSFLFYCLVAKKIKKKPPPFQFNGMIKKQKAL